MTTAYITAQTWTGNTNIDWNTATNLSPSVVLTVTINVVIPGALSTYQVLAGNITKNSINMQSCSAVIMCRFYSKGHKNTKGQEQIKMASSK